MSRSLSASVHTGIRVLAVLLLASGAVRIQAGGAGGTPSGLTQEEHASIRRDLTDLQARLDRLGARKGADPALIADAAVFRKGVVWALRYETVLGSQDTALIRRALVRCRERLEALEAGRHAWSEKKGRLVRGYVSLVDGSVQPYGLVIPDGYQPGRSMRLDVVLHGSTRPTGLSELRFMAPFDEGDTGGMGPPDPYIELHPLGRVENCYRWAGESDVFEAIEDVCRKYAIDRDRIVLRGMSMGASGTWHLGLKHPDYFVALGPYCGYVDTHRFSESPIANFVKVGPLLSHQEAALHMLDSVDYAANAGVVPAVAAMGEKDPFFQAHVIMGEAMGREGLTMVNLISPGTGHVIDPVVHAEQMRRIGEHASRGLDHAPPHVRFVTWTLKYNRCHWLQALSLREHYQRAELEGTLQADGSVDLQEPKNITRFALHTPAGMGEQATVGIGHTRVKLPPPGERGHAGLMFERRGERWRCAGRLHSRRLTGKRPGLQGPVDDAFTGPFLCVRGTGKPWNPAVQAWADASLARFGYEWARYFRGDLPVKDDTAVTAGDLRRCHLILFGDPGSNRCIREALPGLPVRWDRRNVHFGADRYPASDHVPVLIAPNPLPGGDSRYVVLNSGHSFHEKELGSLNYLLFPRLGDWAVIRVGPQQPASASAPLSEEVLKAGFFDEEWKFPK